MRKQRLQTKTLTIVTILLIIIIVILLVILLRGSISKSAVTEKQILGYITEKDDFLSEYNLDVESYEITERKTDSRAGEDKVKIGLTASNYDFSYMASYKFLFGLYDDGWQLEDWQMIGYSYSANHPEDVSSDEAEQVVYDKMNCDNVEFIDRTDDKNSVTLHYQAYTDEYYLRKTYDVYVIYEFTPNDLWKNSDFKYEVISKNPEIVGEWKYEQKSVRGIDSGNINDDIHQFFDKYYSAIANGDEEKIASMWNRIETDRVKQIVSHASDIDYYDDIDCYIKPGYSDDSYIVFVKYAIKYKNVDTEAPGLSTFYVMINDNNQLYIKNIATLSGSAKDFIEETVNAEEIQDLLESVDEEYQAAIDKDPMLKSMMDKISQ